MFDLIADVELGAEVVLAIDLEGDGSVERMEQIPTAHWQPLAYAIAIAPPFDGVRFELTKRGDGRAVLAQLEARIDATACAGLTPIVSADPRPAGGHCLAGTDCASGMCVGGVFGGICEGCPTLGAACGAGQVCGLAQPSAPIFAFAPTCVPSNARVLGEHCGTGAECASTICVETTCSACDPAQPTCGGGATCGPAFTVPDGLVPANRAYVCGAGSHAVAAGAPCGGDADCASAHCLGAVREQCVDGRACDTAFTCPTAGSLAPTTCSTVGIQGGSCE